MSTEYGKELHPVKAATLVHIWGLLSFLLYAVLTFVSRRGEPVPLSEFYTLLGGAWLVLGACFLSIKKVGAQPSLWAILVWAVLFRMLGVAAEPIYENDYFRFLWDGRVFAVTGNPYQVPPVDFFDDPEVQGEFAGILTKVNYPEVPTIYGPVLEYIFLLSYRLGPGSLTVLKLLFLSADLILLGLMAGLTSRRNFMFYAWCPLLVFETSFNAHPDIVGICLLVAAYTCFRKSRMNLTMVWCGAAAAAKIIALPAVAFLILQKGWLRGACIFGLTVAALYAPFLLQGSSADWEGLRAFGAYWEFNSALYALMSWMLYPSVARVVCLLIFAAAFFWLWRRYWNGKYPEPPLDIVFGLFFLVSPVINPWYLQWLIPFAAMRPRFWSITALAVVSLSYIIGYNLSDPSLSAFEHPVWLRPLEFGLIGFAVGLDVFWKRETGERISN